MEEKTEEGNKLFAGFMEIETKTYEDRPTVTRWRYCNSMLFITDLKYHSSFDWLMPVVEKIQTLGYTVSIWCEGDARDNWIWNYCNIFDKDENLIIGGVHDRSKIKAIYESVESFIKWYNQTQITNNPSPLK